MSEQARTRLHCHAVLNFPDHLALFLHLQRWIKGVGEALRWNGLHRRVNMGEFVRPGRVAWMSM